MKMINGLPYVWSCIHSFNFLLNGRQLEFSLIFSITASAAQQQQQL